MRFLRRAYLHLPMWAYRRVHDWVWPSYECKNCNGVCVNEYGALIGCECAYYGAAAPGVGPGRVRAWWQRQLGIRDTGRDWSWDTGDE